MRIVGKPNLTGNQSAHTVYDHSHPRQTTQPDALSPHFNSHFPGTPRLTGTRMSSFCTLLECVRWWWQLQLHDVQSSSQIIITNKPIPGVHTRDCSQINRGCHNMPLPKACKWWHDIHHTCTITHGSDTNSMSMLAVSTTNQIGPVTLTFDL